MDPGSRGLPRVFCTAQILFCTGAIPFRTSARGFVLAGSKRLQQFPRVTRIGSLPPKTRGKSRGPPQSPAETPQNPRRDPAEPSESQISSGTLAEGCAPPLVIRKGLLHPRLTTFGDFPLQAISLVRGFPTILSKTITPDCFFQID